MKQTLSSLPAEGTRQRPARWFTWAISLLILLMGFAAFQSIGRHQEMIDDPLQGDADEAGGALMAILSKTPVDQRLPLLRKHLQDPNPGLRYAAVDALGDLENPAAVPDIESAFTDSSSMVRQRAMESLLKIAPERGMRLLILGLKDEDKWIQEAAAAQFSTGAASHKSFVDKRAVPFLMQTLDNPNETVSTMAMSALHSLTGNPWKTRNDQSASQRQAVIGQWKQWWAKAEKNYPIAPEFAGLVPIRPARMDPAPDFHLPIVAGKEVSLQSQKGRVTLLNFWGTWCPPCQKEIPDLIALDKTYQSRGLDVIGVAMAEESAESLQRWCSAHQVTYRQALAPEAVLASFGYIHEAPVSVLIDKQRRIRYRWDGERDLATFRAAVERLLQENP